ncbi:MAG TPA: di-heme oxidoredictase family protein [Burkholderiales bacterium]|nr:di-heme oxidoredictase family protein [Burkholderiales bacterium]
MRIRHAVPLLLTSVAGLFFFHSQVATSFDFSASDPGVRGGGADAGGPLPGLTANQRAFFDQGLADFNSVEDVADGLGPTMNLDACGGCHAQPAAGGTSPKVNPQVAFATLRGADNKLPSFVRLNGPVREARFVKNPDGSPDGGVHAIFTIQGRDDAPGCVLAQPDFATQLANRNVIFRIPTPVFGAGLIEEITDTTILMNLSRDSSTKSQLGISGRPNRNGNDGTISRFGWKAQNQSLIIFSGEAYNVEMGITNELFQSERDQTPSCQFAKVPNDIQNTDAADNAATRLTAALAATPAVLNFGNFQRFLAPPTPDPDTPGGSNSIGRGRNVFSSIGCALCHTPSMRTGNATVDALRFQTANLYSDLALHNMGNGLADGISQGAATGSEFRTAPLWGLGQRIFFLHDGRTDDLRDAIRQHASNGSEANQVISRFNNLSEFQKQDLLNFLRSL